MVENDVPERNVPNTSVGISRRHTPYCHPDAIIYRKVPYKHVLSTLGNSVSFVTGFDSHSVIVIGDGDVLYEDIGGCGVYAIGVEGKRWEREGRFRPEAKQLV